MKKGKRRFLPAGVVTANIAVALISTFFSAPFAAAQEEKLKQEAAQEEKARGEYELETMTVTAQKQEENIQEVPVSITVFNELDIEDRKIDSVFEMADFVPNFMILHLGGSGLNAPTMRGITARIESGRVSTGLFVDGVPIINSGGFEAEMLDIERIEVLRGPQGTLYGKGTQVGAVNIYTRQPDNDLRGKVSAEGGKLLSAEAGDKLTGAASFSLSGPIMKDRLFFAVAGKYAEKDGFIKNTMTGDTIDDREYWFGRAHLRWVPMEKLDISLIASRVDHADRGDQLTLSETGAAMYGMPTPQERTVSSNLKGGYHDSINDQQSLKIAYNISESLTLTSITANWHHQREDLFDYDFGPLTIMHPDSSFDTTTVSQELRLGYSKERLKWLAGLYYDTYEKDVDYNIASMIPIMMDGNNSQTSTGNTYAVFANLTYPLTGKLSLTTGLRYENEEQDLEDNISHLKTDDSWDGLTPKIALEYSFTPDIMTYISVSKGYRPGGLNLVSANSQYVSYDSENLWSYEIGAKSRFLDNKLIVNGSVYYMDISEMQVSQTFSPVEVYITNAAKATSMGFELETIARLSDGLSLNASFGYTNTEFGSFQDIAGDYEGNKNPWAPKYTFNIGGQYRHGSGFYARADLIGYGKMYLDKANEYSRDAYEIVNVKIGYEADSFDLYLYAKNLFDKKYDIEGYYSGMYTVPSEPGEVGLQLVYRF